MKYLKPLAVLGVLFLAMEMCLAEGEPAPCTGILGAFTAEVELLESQIEGKRIESFLGRDFIVGELRGRRVVLVRSGIGKVNAAVTTALLIDHFHPEEIIFTGVAGSVNPDLFPGDIIIAESTTQHDYGALTPTGFFHAPTKNGVTASRNPLFFPADERLLRLARQASRGIRLDTIAEKKGDRMPKIVTGIVATGDVFVASTPKKGELRTRLKADAVEMEGAAVAQVCHQQKVPCLVVRSCSDSADERAAVDARKFSKTAANNSAKLVMALAALLGGD